LLYDKPVRYENENSRRSVASSVFAGDSFERRKLFVGDEALLFGILKASLLQLADEFLPTE
jgi:hypothetical protein